MDKKGTTATLHSIGYDDYMKLVEHDFQKGVICCANMNTQVTHLLFTLLDMNSHTYTM
jgi:hypothetical protein